MATISSSSPSSLFFNLLLRNPSCSSSSFFPLRSPSSPLPRALYASPKLNLKHLQAASRTIVKAVTEDFIPDDEIEEEDEDEIEEEDGIEIPEDAIEKYISEESVSVPASPSDMLTMFFKAEGMLEESQVEAITDALEDEEGIDDLMVRCTDGVGVIVLTKETTVQATGVASNLVELLQGAGFKLQSLSLSFVDEEDEIPEGIEMRDFAKLRSYVS